ncbi:MAG: hypothetical protein FWC11_02250 [Firmicutes bacterium]|nr:hypothetical protein [Bacillota bacterium]
MKRNSALNPKTPMAIRGAIIILVGLPKKEIISLPEAKPAPITEDTINIEIEKIFFTHYYMR